MKALAVNRIQTKDKEGNRVSIAASTAANPSVFDVSETEFKKLLALGAVRKPTDDELAIAKAAAERAGNSFEDNATGAVVENRDAHSSPAPKSNAAGDPNGTPAGATKPLADMTKAELVELAEAEQIEIDATANKPVILEAIEKARKDRDGGDLGI